MGRTNCWHQITWMNPILQLECSLLGCPGQLARHPLPAIPTSWSVAFWPVGAGPSHHRHAGSHGLLGLTGPGRPDGRLLHLRSLEPRTCGCLNWLSWTWTTRRWNAWQEVEGPLPEHVSQLGRPLPSPDGVLSRPHLPGHHHHVLGQQRLLGCHHHVLGQQRLLGRPRSLARHSLPSCPPCWLVTRRVDQSSFAESGTWAALPCRVIILLGPSHCEDDPSRKAKTCDQEYRTHRRSVTWFHYLALLTGSERLFTQVGIKDVLCQMWCGKTPTPATDWQAR